MRRMRGEDAVRGVSAVHIKVAILKATFSLVEHIKRLRLVLLDGGNSLVEHGLGFLCSTILGYLRWYGCLTHGLSLLSSRVAMVQQKWAPTETDAYSAASKKTRPIPLPCRAKRE